MRFFQIAMMQIASPVGIKRSELALEFSSAFFSRFCGAFSGRKETDVFRTTVNRHTRVPFIHLFGESHANETGYVVSLFGFVDAILRFCRSSKFVDSIVSACAVSVINFARKILAVDVQPRQDMRRVVATLSDLDFDVAVFGGAAGDSTCISVVPSVVVRARLPEKRTCFGDVAKKRMNEFLSESRKVRHVFDLSPVEDTSAYHSSNASATLEMGA